MLWTEVPGGGRWAQGHPRWRKRLAKKGKRGPGPLKKAYYSNGQLKSAGRYLYGKRNGPWKFYHRNGNLWAAGTFERGECKGLWKWFADNGVVRQVGRFDGGCPVGEAPPRLRGGARP